MAKLFFFFSLTFSLVLLPCTFSQGTNPEIQKVCAPALFKDRCIKTLTEAPGSNKASVKELAIIIVNLTKSHGEKMNTLINNKLKDNATPSEIKKVLKDCQEEYSDAMEQIDKSAEGLKNPTPMAFSDAQTFLSATLTNVDSCEDELTSKKVDLDKDGNKVLKELISSSLAVVNAARNA